VTALTSAGDRNVDLPARSLQGDSFDTLREAVDAAPDAVAVCGANHTVLFANQLASSMFGYGTGELNGLPIVRILPDAGFDTTTLRDSASGRDQSSLGMRRDGSRLPIECGINVVGTGDSRYLVISFTDVTERLNLEARLVAASPEHSEFQALISDLVGEFANVDADALDELILHCLRRLVAALQLDRASLWRWNSENHTAVPVHDAAVTADRLPIAPFPLTSSPFIASRLEAGEAVSFTALEELPDSVDRTTFRLRGERSALLIPMPYQGGGTDVHWVLTASSMTRELEWPPAIVERLRLVAGVISQALARRASQVALQQALDDLHQLRTRPSETVVRRPDGPRTGAASRIVSESTNVREALQQIEQVAGTSATVLLRGETGSGKEVFAQAIHDLSPRHRRPMVIVSCAAIPTALIESELFGRERGAYTGALSRQIGRFEAAHQSTLFLDEIGDLPAEMQVKLLRVLQERVIERLGSTQPIKVDVRIIAATHRDLEQAVHDGTFREDLFYRLNVFPICVPPLRERIADIPGLVWAFVDELSRAFGKTITSIAPASMQELQRYPWPGNVRELRNVIERAVILATTEHLVVPMPHPTTTTSLPPTAMTLASLETEHIRAILDSTHWRVRGRGGAAERLGLKPTTLESRMARLGIVRERAS
jgi:formate hydrogenlyase transcriptional activator